MSGYVADTHALIWYLQDSKRLGPAARLAFTSAEEGLCYIYVPSMCLVELVLLEERGRMPAGTTEIVHQVLASESNGLIVVPLTADVAKAVGAFSRNEIPDMPDRVIAATAVQLGLPLLTKDQVIQASSVDTVW